MRFPYIVALFTCLIVSAARAQNAPADTTRSTTDTSLLDSRLKVGTRVRVRVTSLSPGDVEGRITEIRRDTLVIARRSGDPLTVPAGELSRIQIGRGNQAVAATLGTLGFIGGNVLYFSFCSRNRETCRKDIEEAQQDTSNHNPIPPLYMASAFGAAVLGGAIGEAISPERWNGIEKPLRFSFVPTRRGMMVVASITVR
jgi:hypothetical protein